MFQWAPVPSYLMREQLTATAQNKMPLRAQLHPNRGTSQGDCFSNSPSHLRQECIIRHPVILTDWTQFQERKTSKVKLCLIKVSGCVPAREQQSFCVSALRFRKEKKEESVSLSSAGKVFNNK